MCLFLQLKVYATRKSIYSPISEDYGARAETAETIKMWHTNYARESYYISTTFCAFPLVGIFFICFAVYYYNESQENYRMYKINKLYNSVDCYGKRVVKYELQNELIVSMMFSFYILILSICGVIYTQNDIYLNDYVKDDFSIYNLGTTLEYSVSLAIIALSLDLGIVVVVQTIIVVVVNKIRDR